MLIYKTCTTCETTKPLYEFRKEKKGKYGVMSVCRKCSKEWNAKYNADPINKARKNLLDRTPKAREKRRIAAKDRRMEIKIDKFTEIFLEELKWI